MDMAELYPFTEWPNIQVDLRFKELIALAPVRHGLVRTEELSREMSHLLFEMTSRDYRLPTPPVDMRKGTWHFR